MAGPEGVENGEEEARTAASKLQDTMFNIRRDACKTLAKVGSFAAPYLEQLKVASEKDEDLDVKKAAREAIRLLREQGVELKKEEVKLPDPKQQQLDEQNQVWATRAGKQLNDKSWNVRKDGCKRMGTVGHAAEPYLPKLHELLQDERAEVQKAAELAIKKLKESGVTLPEPVAAEEEEEPEAPAEDDEYDDYEPDERKPAPVQVPEEEVKPEWWESMPGGPAWNPEETAGVSYESALLEQQELSRIIPKEEKVEVSEHEMMLEAAQSASEDVQDVSEVVRREACRVLAGLGKYAKPHLALLKGISEKDPAPSVRLAAKAALRELAKDNMKGASASSTATANAPKPEVKVTVLAPSPTWTGPVASFRILDEVLPMLLLSEKTQLLADVIKIWEDEWKVKGANRIRFQLQPEEGKEGDAAPQWLNPREDIVPLAPAIVRLEAKVGSVLSSLAGALKQKVAEEDTYREERLNRRKGPRSKLWIEGPPLLRRTAAEQPPAAEAPRSDAKDVD